MTTDLTAIADIGRMASWCQLRAVKSISLGPRSNVSLEGAQELARFGKLPDDLSSIFA